MTRAARTAATLLAAAAVAAAAAAGAASAGAGCYRYKAPELSGAYKGLGEADKPKPPPPPADARTYAGDALGYRLRMPAGWTFGDVDDVENDALGGRVARKRLEATEGGGTAETRATLTVVVRDAFLDGEDLVRRDLDAWLRALAASHTGLSSPAARALPAGAPGGVVFALNGTDATGKAWAYDRAYVFAVATARSYVLTVRLPADRRRGFSGQIDALLEGLELMDPPEGNPADAAGCVREAAGLLADGRLAKAAHCYEMLLDKSAGDPGPLRFGLGTALERMGLRDEALAEYRRSAEEAKGLGDRARARLAEGLLLRRAEKLADAVVAYQKGLEVSPGDRRLLLNLGLALHLSGDPGRAAAAYDEILAADAGDVEALENCAAALRDAGRLDEAKERLERAIALRRKAVAGGGDGALEAARWLAKDEEALAKVTEKLKR
ncbi:MAG TPA: tetratricopeptide repeat protein [Myxococcota bacterium]|jgi:tetratricopeptide (TPR) repeat protein|nr:tetratricopeptide repeat protein [Myxococcota bacterium]